MQVKSDKLKKLEAELKDLERWLELGLVPKKDQEKHSEEIEAIRSKMEEETDRLKFLKKHGDLDEYVAPKRGATKAAYQSEMPSLPDVEVGETGYTQGGQQTLSGTESDNTVIEPADDAEETAYEDEDEESYFSDKARWKRGGGIIDPEADDW